MSPQDWLKAFNYATVRGDRKALESILNASSDQVDLCMRDIYQNQYRARWDVFNVGRRVGETDERDNSSYERVSEWPMSKSGYGPDDYQKDEAGLTFTAAPKKNQSVKSLVNCQVTIHIPGHVYHGRSATVEKQERGFLELKVLTRPPIRGRGNHSNIATATIRVGIDEILIQEHL